MTKDFSFNGTTLKKGQKLKIKKGFSKKGEIDQTVANALIKRGVAMVKDDPKPTNNRPSKK
jgi:hypothetical protein